MTYRAISDEVGLRPAGLRELVAGGVILWRQAFDGVCYEAISQLRTVRQRSLLQLIAKTEIVQGFI